MSHRVKVFISLIILITTFCCEPNSDQTLRSIWTKHSASTIGNSEYYHVYQLAQDTLTSWIEGGLVVSKMQQHAQWKLDSLLCFNSKKNRCIMAIVNRESATVNNSINIFYGVKIKTKWYFFYGPTMYPDPLNHTPLSFARLHQIAMQEIFRGYLKKKDKGFWGNIFQKQEWEINERFFNQLDYSKWGFFDQNGKVVDNSTLSQSQLDSHLLAKAVFEKWKHRDTTNYKNTDSL